MDNRVKGGEQMSRFEIVSTNVLKKCSNIFSIIFAIFGGIFSWSFQFMAYIGNAGMLWYWIGVILAYTFSIIAAILSLSDFGNKENGEKEMTMKVITWIIIIPSIMWGTFVFLAGQAGI